MADASSEARAQIRRLLLLGSERRYAFSEADTAEGTTRAVLDAPEGPPDCLVLDEHLTSTRTSTVLASLADRHGRCVCPVLVLTAGEARAAGRDAIGAGAQGLLGKGWMTAESLTQAVEHAVERHQMTGELRAQAAAARRCEARSRLLACGVPYMAWVTRSARSATPAVGKAGSCIYATDRRRTEQALQDANRRKDEFLATLGHELRNPLAPIRIGLEILRRDEARDDTTSRTHDMMGRQLEHLVRLVDDLLDVSRINRGKLELKPERVEVRTILTHAVETSRPWVEAGGHTLVVQLPDAPVWVDGDLTRLGQVFANLLNNAAKYTPNGGRISLLAGVEGDEAVVRVVDDGIGITAEMLPRVFGLFAQVDHTLQRAQGGLGIGLSLARTLVELHGGTLAAESLGLGRGSTFTARLPLASAVGGRASPASEPPPPRPSSRRILVVDDNGDGAETLAMLLELSGHEARAVSSGQAALDAVRTFRPEVVFLDLGMPGMDGYEVARRLLADPTTAGVVLIALTGWGGEDARRRSKAAGFDLHLVKPVRPADVADALARCSTLPRPR